MVFDTILQSKKLMLFGEMADARPRAENVQDVPETSCSAWKERNISIKPHIDVWGSEGTRANWKRPPWSEVSSKINEVILDYNPKYKINIHLYIIK